jgi:hypothetical protein
VVEAFAGNHHVAFGDVNLSQDPVRRNYSPGAGGWPTVRRFDAASGLDGVPYEKQTSMSMCDELGPDHSYLHDWVAEYAQPCSVLDESGCDERQLQYLHKQKNNDAGQWKQQLERLEKLEAGGNSMKADLLQWIRQRKKILQTLMQQDTAGHAEL